MMIAILTGVRSKLHVILRWFSFTSRMLSISSCVYWPFVLFLLGKLSVQFICPFIQWVVDSLQG
jgi:hypothetical protein